MDYTFLILFLAIPLLVHLFDFRQAKRYYFSSVRYISSLVTKSKKQSKVKYIFILTNRLLLFISVLLFIYFLSLSDDEYSGDSFLLYFDNSLSSELANGYAIADKLLTELSAGTTKGVYYDNSKKLILEDNQLSIIDGRTTSSTRDWRSILAKSENSRFKNYFIVSDFQNSDFAGTKDLVSDTTRNYHLVAFNDLKDISNVVVDSLYVSPDPNDISRLSINVVFKKFNTAEENIIIKLTSQGKQLGSVVKSINELDLVNFDVPINQNGVFQIVIEGDFVAYDNIFHFALKGQQKTKIVIIDESDKEFILTVFRNNPLFEVSNQDWNNLDYEVLKKSDLIIVNGIKNLTQEFKNQFGSSFLVFPSKGELTEDFNRFLGFKVSSVEESITEIDFERKHPLLKGVFTKKLDQGLMPKIPLNFRLEGDFENVIRFRSNTPFLVKKDNVYFFNTVLTDDNGFQSEALFLPLLYQIAFASINNIANPYYYPGEVINIEAMFSINPIKLRNEVVELIPEFNYANNVVSLRIPNEIHPGVYDIVQGDEVLHKVTINLPKSESFMTSPEIKDIQANFVGMENVFVSKVDTTTTNLLQSSSDGVGLWKYALILALILVLSETVLHRYLK